VKDIIMKLVWTAFSARTSDRYFCQRRNIKQQRFWHARLQALRNRKSQNYSDLTQPFQAISEREESSLRTLWMHVRDLKVSSVLEWCDWLASCQAKPLPGKDPPMFILHSNLEVCLCKNFWGHLLYIGHDWWLKVVFPTIGNKIEG